MATIWKKTTTCKCYDEDSSRTDEIYYCTFEGAMNTLDGNHGPAFYMKDHGRVIAGVNWMKSYSYEKEDDYFRIVGISFTDEERRIMDKDDLYYFCYEQFTLEISPVKIPFNPENNEVVAEIAVTGYRSTIIYGIPHKEIILGFYPNINTAMETIDKKIAEDKEYNQRLYEWLRKNPNLSYCHRPSEFENGYRDVPYCSWHKEDDDEISSIGGGSDYHSIKTIKLH